jgi:hypothetical protein
MDTLLISNREQSLANHATSCHETAVIAPKSTCPCHPGEVRSERFAVLDALINARWGSVPLNVITREAMKRGRILVSELPKIHLIVEQRIDGLDYMRLESRR